MNEEQAIVHPPAAGEPLEPYLQRFLDEELRQIQNDPELLLRFAAVLQESFRDFEKLEDGLENLWKIIKNANDLDRLLYFIRQLEPIRRNLLESLARNEDKMQTLATFSAVGRLFGSTVDVLGTVYGLWMRKENPGYARLAFRAATAFGLMGLVTTVAEMNILKNTLDDLMRLLEEDQNLFEPIQRWYQKTIELEEAMKAVFPFDVTNHLVAEFSNVSGADISPVRLLATLLKSIAEQDFQRLRDARLIRNLINFTLYPASRDWCEWIILRRHPVILDITRVILQLQHSPLRFALCQSIPALAIGDQSIRSFPVWGRIGLNLVSAVDSVTALTSSETSTIVSEIRHLRRHLLAELNSLIRIAEFVTIRRRNT